MRITNLIEKYTTFSLHLSRTIHAYYALDLDHSVRYCDAAETPLNMLDLARIYIKPSLSSSR